jgi:hypothetical protein
VTTQWRQAVTVAAWAALTLSPALLSGCSENCLQNSDCETNETCRLGTCRRACAEETDCPLGETCSSGACVTAVDAARPSTCTADGGCPPDGGGMVADAGTDTPDMGGGPREDAAVLFDAGAVVDAGEPRPDANLLFDGGGVPLDVGMVEEDAAPEVDAFVGDGGPAGPVNDLTGTYAVTRTVRLSGDNEFPAGRMDFFIASLTSVEGEAYNLEVRDQMGGLVFEVRRLDFASPEGPPVYQFEYTREPPDPPEGCVRTDRVFQRGEVEPVDDLFRLTGDEDLEAAFSGDECNEDDFLVRFAWVWIPIPPEERPEPNP